jgi:dihydroflavonol-4-reductase
MILVTGGTGFIGGHLVERLAHDGEPVRCLVRRKLPDGFFPPSVETAFGDLSNGNGLDAALEGVDTVIHLAGVTKAVRPDGYYAGNARASETLARSAAARPIRFVHVSSLAAAGPGEMVTETAEPKPVSLYGKSKLAGELAVRGVIPAAVIVRPPVVYGPRDDGVFQVIKPAARGLSPQIAGGDRRFSAIFVRDLVEGLLLAARSPRAAGRTYFLTNAKPTSWEALGATVARTVGRKPPRVLPVPYPAAWVLAACLDGWSRISGRASIFSRDKLTEARCPAWTCDGSRAAAELGFEARTSIEEGLAETVAWYKEAGWLDS